MEINKVFGIGVQKTGTSSLAEALNRLGIRCGHWNVSRKMMPDIEAGRYTFECLETYEALADHPVPAVFRELDRNYPGSKFVLTVRDPEDWIVSVRHWAERKNRRDGALTPEEVLFYGIPRFDESVFRARYEEHVNGVREYFRNRKQDLLVMDICDGDGWEVLCPFLGRPVPSDPFPHIRPVGKPLGKLRTKLRRAFWG